MKMSSSSDIHASLGITNVRRAAPSGSLRSVSRRGFRAELREAAHSAPVDSGQVPGAGIALTRTSRGNPSPPRHRIESRRSDPRLQHRA